MAQIPERSAARETDPAYELPRCFGRQVKILRERAGLTQAALAQQLAYSEAQTAVIEQGAAPTAGDHRPPRQPAGRRRAADGHEAGRGAHAVNPSFLRDAARIEEEAVQAYAVLAVPGLLQAEEYARTMFTVPRPRRRADEIEEKVAARLARRKIYDGKPAPTLSFVIEESVLERPFGGQLEHIRLVAENPHVEIQIMPSAPSITRARAARSR